MKPLLFGLLILSCFGVTKARTQSQGNDEYIKSEIFGLLKLKQKYDDKIARMGSNANPKDRLVATDQLDKSEYGKTYQAIRNNSKRYLDYIEKTLKNDTGKLHKQYVDFQPSQVWESRAPDYYFISHFDYLRIVKQSLLDPKSDRLLPLGKVSDVKMRYAPHGVAVRPIERK